MPEKQSLARVLSSTGRIKILTVLSHVGELHLTEIAKQTDQSYSSTQRHLEDLSNAAIVEEHDYGRVRMFKLNGTTDRCPSKFKNTLKRHWRLRRLRS